MRKMLGLAQQSRSVAAEFRSLKHNWRNFPLKR
jgi:hypothetical protein